MTKSASDPMTICITDQTSNGYSGDDAIKICASIRELFFKEAQISGNDDEDEEENTDQVEFEDENNDSEEPEENIEEIDDDDDDMVEIEDDDDDMVEFTEEDELEEEFEEEGLEAPAIEIEKLELYGKDGEGNTFEVEYDLSDMEPEVEEGPEDFGDTPDEEGMDDEVVVIEDEIEGPEEETDVFDLADIFTMPDEGVEEFDDEEDEIDEETAMMMASSAELLRGGRVSSSSNAGGSTLDIKALAQAISMPLDTQAPDVPRDEDSGIRYDGEVEPHESDHPNTAKDMQDGGHRGTAYTDPEIDRGVEQIEATPQKEAGSRVTVKKAESDPGKPTPEGDDMNHCCPDGSFETGKFEHKDNKGKGKKKSEAATKCAGCGGVEGKCGCGGGGGGGKTVMKKKKSMEGCMPKKKKSMEGYSCSASNNGWFEVKTAQGVPTVKEPVDSIQDDKKLPMSADSEDTLDVPRNEAKGKPQDFKARDDVNNPTEVRGSDYAFGQEGKDLHTDEVPRDSSGDGIGGESVTFEKDTGVDATSGNPDTYVQEWQDNVKPTPAGKEDNHATSGPNTAASDDEVKTAIAQQRQEVPGSVSLNQIGSSLANNLSSVAYSNTGGMVQQVTHSVPMEFGGNAITFKAAGATPMDIRQLIDAADQVLRSNNIQPDSVAPNPTDPQSFVVDLTTHRETMGKGGMGFGASARDLVIKEAKKVISQQIAVDIDKLDAVDFEDKILISIEGTDRLFEVDPSVFANKVEASQEESQMKTASKCDCGCDGDICKCGGCTCGKGGDCTCKKCDCA
jgi:hypothetical protein